MIDPTHPLASWFLWAAAALFLAVYAVPILVAPLWWARRFRWTMPEHTHLAVYFGRCLGALAVAVVVLCIRAAPHPQEHTTVFELLVVAGSLLTGVHVWGAVRRQQPWTETAEIALYGLLTIVAYVIYRGL